MKNIKNVGELKDELSIYPDDSSIVLEILDTTHDDLYGFYVDDVKYYDNMKDVIGHEVRLTLNTNKA